MDVANAAMQKEIEMQRAYYAQTANLYDDMHVHDDGEHSLALSFMLSMIEYHGIRSILDVGSGTGRGLSKINPRSQTSPQSVLSRRRSCER
jgi:hypothetical protein